MIASLQNSFAWIQTLVTSKLQGFFSNAFIAHLIKTFSSIPNQNCSGNLNFKEVSFGHFGFAYCKQAIRAHGNCAIIIGMTGLCSEVFIFFDICIAIVTVAEFLVLVLVYWYMYIVYVYWYCIHMNVFSNNNKRWAGNICGATHGWNAHAIHGIRNGIV